MPPITHVPGSFCWFELATTNQTAAKDFYSSIFGWRAEDTPMGPGEFYTMFRLQGLDAAAGYTLRADQRAQDVLPHWMIYITVADANAAAARARELGGTVIAEPLDVMDHGRMSVIQDPTGAMFCVWQPIRHQGTGISNEHGTVTWADLSTPDQVRDGQFYSDLFGWKMAADESLTPAQPGTYFHIVNGETMIGGVPPESQRAPGTPAHWMLYFQVDDCAATEAQIAALGGTVLMPTMEMDGVRKIAIVADPQGATFALVQSL